VGRGPATSEISPVEPPPPTPPRKGEGRRRVYGLSIDRNPSPEFLATLEIRPLPMGEVT
jgi:hypothetical protein